jgi:phage head maturation protease
MEDGTGYSYLDMVKGKFLNAVSIGFGGIKFSLEKIQEQTIRVWDETDLLEVSLVPIPAQPEAIQKALKWGFEHQILEDYTNNPAPVETVDDAEAIRKAFEIYKLRHFFHRMEN